MHASIGSTLRHEKEHEETSGAFHLHTLVSECTVATDSICSMCGKLHTFCSKKVNSGATPSLLQNACTPHVHAAHLDDFGQHNNSCNRKYQRQAGVVEDEDPRVDGEGPICAPDEVLRYRRQVPVRSAGRHVCGVGQDVSKHQHQSVISSICCKPLDCLGISGKV